MSTKEYLLELKKKVLSRKDKLKEDETEEISEVIDNIVNKNIETNDKEVNKTINLDDLVDEYIKWYYKKMVKGNYTDIGEYNQPRKMRNLIEKIAVWYELRYPEYEINRLMRCSGQEDNSVNDNMFRNNIYINDIYDTDDITRELEWSEFYNANAFIKSLPCTERYLFSKPIYNKSLYLSPSPFNIYFTKNGIVEGAENVSVCTNSIIKDEELIGLHARKVLKLFNIRGVELPDNELKKMIAMADKWIYQREEMLNCVMYRIIERGGNRIGPRRAFLFAKEFGRNIDIPMKYGVDTSDPGLRSFINEYIKAGGSKDLVCYKSYFSRKSKKENVETITIQELIRLRGHNAATFYTPEEDDLHEKLATILASKIDYNALNKEKIKKLRIERKLKNSKK